MRARIETILKFVAGCVISGTLLLVIFGAFRLYSFGYFYADDFNNLALAQRYNITGLMRDNTRPAASTFRPAGAAAFWAMVRLADLQPMPYRIAGAALHAVNAFLLFLLLRFATQSSYAAAFGTLFFTFQVSFSSVFYSFANIYEVLAGLWFLLGLLIYARWGNTPAGLIALPFIYFVACNSKEMAITLPCIWLLYDLLIRPNDQPLGRWALSLMKRLAAPSLVGLWFLYVKAGMMHGTPPTDPYHMDFSPRALFQGYVWYANAAYETKVPAGLWAGLAAVLGLLAVWRRWPWVLFFLLYTLITLLPVVFLVNHRGTLYWYIPAVGPCGLIALFVAQLARSAARYPRAATVVGVIVFVLAAHWHYKTQVSLTQHERNWVRDLSNEYRSFISGLRQIPQPGPNATIYFASIPRNLDAISVQSAVQLVFSRSDLTAEIVEMFPPQARYRARFEGGRVVFSR
ncbi:MAG TPA: hypothetical protein VGK99_00130 [Acidobacteriota bacterium]